MALSSRARDLDKRPLSQPLELREMRLEDLPSVFALGEKLFSAGPWPNLYRTWDDYQLLEMFASDRDMCLVAEEDNEIVGFILGTIIEKRRSSWTYGYIVWLAVDPKYAGQGVGMRLVSEITDIFIDYGARIVLADTDAENEPAIRFFDRMGFDNKRDHIYLSKNLADHPTYLKRQKERRKRKRDHDIRGERRSQSQKR